jgi:uncharacterized protein (DUF1800 family)
MSVLEAAAGVALGAAAMSRPDESQDLIFNLVQRMTFGQTPSELNLATALGPTAYIEYHLNYEAIDDGPVEAMLAQPAYSTLYLKPYAYPTQSSTNVVNTLIRMMVLRAVYSNRQFYERMVEFWTDHFNIWVNQDGVQLLKTVDDREVIRPNALGNFGTMLKASAHSPAMSEYLNNNTNTAASPNENYARELMELHTLSVNGGYTQNDVHEVARCFTGWTYYSGASGANSYSFRYNPSVHDTGSKVVLGNTIPARSAAAGVQDADDVLNILIAHPSTAQFISKKLLARFWGENPPQNLIDMVAAAYTSTSGDIKAMMRVVLALVAAGTQIPKYKRPFHLLASILRILSANVAAPGSLQTDLTLAGHLPMNWVSPDGYPDTLTYWVGGLLPRWNFAASLMNNQYSQVTVNEATVLAGATTPQAIVDRLNKLLFGGAMPATDQATVLAYLGTAPSTTTKREAIGLAASSPAFQWC